MNPFRQLHPTLKKCKCNFVGTRTHLHKHLTQVEQHYIRCNMTLGEFFADHGEVPHYEDNPVNVNPTGRAGNSQWAICK